MLHVVTQAACNAAFVMLSDAPDLFSYPLAPRNPAAVDVFLSASGDTTVRIWDLRHAGPTLTLPAHAYEVLTAGEVVDVAVSWLW